MTTSPRARVRVLVAAGDLAERDLLDVVLSAGAFDVSFALDGRQALARLKDDAPDAMIVARHIPGLPGDEVCERVRRVPRLASMILVLIDDPQGPLGLSADQIADADRLGVDLIVPRPLGDKNLVQRIDALHADRSAGSMGGNVGLVERDGGNDGSTGSASLAPSTVPPRPAVREDVASLHRHLAEVEARLQALAEENAALRESLERAPDVEGEREGGRGSRSGR